MAISFRMGVSLQTTGGSLALNPGTDPSGDDILIVAQGQSASSGTPGNGSLTSNTFGGTWTGEHGQLWGSRRWLDVWVNDDWTTASGSVTAVDGVTNNQDCYAGMVIVEGSTGTYTEDATAGDASGSNWTPTLTGSTDAQLVIIQHESNETVTMPSGWTQLARVGDNDGLRTLTIAYHIGALTDTTPTFTFPSGANGYTGWSAYFTAAAGGNDKTATGSTSITLSASGTVTAKTASTTGTSQLALAASGTAAEASTTTGTTTIALAASGTAVKAGDTDGSAALTLSASGAATQSESKSSTGTTTLTFVASGATAKAGAATGSTGLTLSADGATAKTADRTGTTTLTFAASGAAVKAGDTDGTTTLTFAASGAAVKAGDTDGTTTLTFAASGAAEANATATIPDAIVDLAAVAGDTQVVLTWTAPDDGGSPITDYIVEYRVAP